MDRDHPTSDAPAAADRFAFPPAALWRTQLAEHASLRFEVASYVEQILVELGTMTRAAELQHLQYCLDLGRQEAERQRRRWGGKTGGALKA